jgi:PAS domain S-box-containing protein
MKCSTENAKSKDSVLSLFNLVNDIDIPSLNEKFLQSREPLALYDENLMFVRVNLAFAELFNNKPSHLVGQVCYRILYKRDTPCDNCQIALSFQDKKPKIWEEMRRLPSGEKMFFEVRTSPVNFSTKTSSIAAMLRLPITKKRFHELLIGDSENLFRSYVEIAQDGIFILDIDARLVYANNSCLEMLEYKLEEIQGMSFFQLLFKEKLFPANIQWTKDKVAVAKEISFLKKDTTPVVVRMSLSTMKQGNIFVGAIGIISDITPMKKIESQLRQNKEFSDNVINSITDSLVVIDPVSYKVTMANKHFALARELNKTELLDKTCHEIIYGRNAPCHKYGVQCPVYETALSGTPTVIEREILTTDKLIRKMRVSTYPINDNSNKISQVVRHEHDITDFKQIEARLFEKTQNLERAHEQLKTLFESTEYMTGIDSLSDIIDYICKTIQDILPDSAVICFILNDQKDKFLPFSDCQSQWSDGLRSAIKTLSSHHTLQSFVEFLDTQTIAEVITNTNLDFSSHLSPIIKNFQNWFALPILNRQQCLGCFVTGFSSHQTLSSEDQQFLCTLTTQAGGYIRHFVTHESEISKLRQQIEKRTSLGKIIGVSKTMQTLYDMIELVADTDATVLVTGESGTGKELVARAIHDTGNRKNGPFIPAHCAGLPPNLIESELFGHEKGSFTGATHAKKGRIERANNGTLFFDEIGEINEATQVTLLRFLQNRRFERVGSEKMIEANVRIIAATNRNIEKEVSHQRFRKDFYYRIAIISIHVPPLRERKEDIPLLVDHFLMIFCKDQKLPCQINQDVMKLFMDYDWPGNVRQLENTINHAVILARDGIIQKEHLPTLFTQVDADVPNSNSLAEHERALIQKILNETGGNKHQAALRLQITRSTLYSKIKRHGLSNNEFIN